MLLHPLLPIALFLTACASGFSDPSREYGPPVEGGSTGRVEIHRPSHLGRLDTPLTDVHGTPIGAACGTCHGGPEDTDALATPSGNPDSVHGDIELRHGAITCDSCHDPEDRRLLRLANGRKLEMDQAMDLCAQCHGTQLRDYTHGAHGGMSGAWDLRRGDRLRNHCVDCHAPHAPAWSTYTPVLRPQDRGTVQMRESHPEGGTQ